MTNAQIVAQAVEDSVCFDRIAEILAEDPITLHELATELLCIANDSITFQEAGHYWGRTEDGDPWRVSLRPDGWVVGG